MKSSKTSLWSKIVDNLGLSSLWGVSIFALVIWICLAVIYCQNFGTGELP